MDGKRALVLAVLGASLFATAQEVETQDKRWIYDIFVQKCRDAGRTPASSYKQFLAGEKFKCVAGASGASSSRGRGGGCHEAEINIAWVFRNAGARVTYLRNRKAGLAPLDAVIAAQAHNPNAQRSIKECGASARIVARFAHGAGPSNAAVLSKRRLGPGDCKCISVVPTGKRYNVSNSCDPMRVSVQFGGDILRLSPSAKAFSSWGAAGIVAAGKDFKIGAPDGWTIISINAVKISNAGGSFICRMN